MGNAAVRRLLQRPELASVGGLVIAFVSFSLATPLFLTKTNFVSFTGLAAQFGIVAVGVTLLMIGGQFDLSVGAIVGLTGWGMFFFGQELGLPPVLTIICALAFGTLLGFLNGVIQVRTGLSSFIVTLATALVYRGFLTMQTSGFPVVVRFPDSYARILSGPALGGFRMSLFWFLLVAAAATFFLQRTRTGNWVFAIGQNPGAARNLGVPVRRTTVLLFTVSGFTSALAGVIMAVQYFSIDANRGVGWELYAIAITVIGGTLLTGGYGSVVGSVLGAFLYASVSGGLLLIGLQGYWVQIFVGVVLLLAVVINRLMVTQLPMIGQTHTGLPAQDQDDAALEDPPIPERTPQ
jgi:simple sugar transport system permease protein